MTMKVPTGCMFTHIVRGSGRTITYQNAGVDCAFVGALSSGFCDRRIDITCADTNNRAHRRSRGRTHSECEIDPMRNNAPAFFAFFPGLPHVIDWGGSARLPARGRAYPMGLPGLADEGGREGELTRMIRCPLRRCTPV
ncbi:hypothetical protein [Streptomyces poonensis]|uniref:hypothetical protein n=1 Tax=Streptomyces poonensis TaxID=68255 RepID=UPI001E459616|nr:hypothetical protein [Streptomyces poonensis]